jgi:hypothetical protein
MFNNSTHLANTADGSAAVITATSIINGPTNRKTERSSADGKLALTIAHQESNENPGFPTQRSNVRISRVFDVAESDRTVVGYVQFTMSFPKDHVTVAQMTVLVAQLVNFLRHSENEADEVLAVDDDFWLSVARLMAGEP